MCVKYEYIRSKIADNSGSIWSVNRNKYQLILVMWVTVSQHMRYEFFHKCRLCPLSSGLKDALPRSTAISPVGHWHVSLVCIRYCSKMSGRERTVRSMPHYRHIIVVELDTAPRRTLLWSAVQLAAVFADFSHYCIAWDAVNNISHITWKTVYKEVDLYAGLEFWMFFLTIKKAGRLMCVSTYTRTCTFSMEQVLLRIQRRKGRVCVIMCVVSWAILQCGPMPNVMAALPNVGGALCSTPQFGWCSLLECRAVTLPRCETVEIS